MENSWLREKYLVIALELPKPISLGMGFDLFDLLLTFGTYGTPGTCLALCRPPCWKVYSPWGMFLTSWAGTRRMRDCFYSLLFGLSPFALR